MLTLLRMSATKPNEIRDARELLAKAGLLDAVTPLQLVMSSRELKKPLREALEAVASLFSE